MDNRPIMKVIMDDGTEVELTMDDVVNNLYALIKVIYFDYMLSDGEATLEDMKKCFHFIVEETVDSIHSKYVDHVEGRRREVFDRKAVNE